MCVVGVDAHVFVSVQMELNIFDQGLFPHAAFFNHNCDPNCQGPDKLVVSRLASPHITLLVSWRSVKSCPRFTCCCLGGLNISPGFTTVAQSLRACVWKYHVQASRAHARQTHGTQSCPFSTCGRSETFQQGPP